RPAHPAPVPLMHTNRPLASPVFMNYAYFLLSGLSIAYNQAGGGAYLTEVGAGQEQAAGPLAGVRVIECGSLIAGPFCGQLLGDFGAEVIKVEDPAGGDPMRQWGPAKVDGRSLHWPIIARNKKSVTANLRVEEGQQLLRELANVSDVLIENFRPGTLERWGL